MIASDALLIILPDSSDPTKVSQALVTIIPEKPGALIVLPRIEVEGDMCTLIPVPPTTLIELFRIMFPTARIPVIETAPDGPAIIWLSVTKLSDAESIKIPYLVLGIDSIPLAEKPIRLAVTMICDGRVPYG